MRTLTGREARRIALWRQGLLGTPPAPGTRARQVERVRALVRDLGAVQLDTISTLARTHELVAHARLGAVARPAIEEAYWDGDSSFEYWSHAACILPMDSWPLFAFRRRHFARRRSHWHEVDDAEVRRVVRRMRADGPVTTGDLGGAKSSSEWWDWSGAKIAVEWLLNVGTVVCTQRRGWRRVYDLAERAIPADLRTGPTPKGWRTRDGVQGPADDECLATLTARSLDVMGVGTLDDIADVHRLTRGQVQRHLTDAGAVPVQVQGWDAPAFASSDALAWLDSGDSRRSRTTLLSPFDSLIWHRPRTQRLFGMEHRLEAYTPAPKRVHGYFAMPVLHGDALVARVDPKRERAGLHARRVTLEDDRTSTITGTARALREAATWVGADDVIVDEVVPASATSALRRAVAQG